MSDTKMTEYTVTGLRWHRPWTMVVRTTSKSSARKIASRMMGEGVSVPSINVQEGIIGNNPRNNPWIAKKGNEVAVFRTRLGVVKEMGKGQLIGGVKAPWNQFVQISTPRRKPGRPKKGEVQQEQYNPTGSTSYDPVMDLVMNYKYKIIHNVYAKPDQDGYGKYYLYDPDGGYLGRYTSVSSAKKAADKHSDKNYSNPIEVRKGGRVVYRGRDIPGIGAIQAMHEAKRWGEGATVAPIGYGRFAEPPKKRYGGLVGMVFGKGKGKKLSKSDEAEELKMMREEARAARRMGLI